MKYILTYKLFESEERINISPEVHAKWIKYKEEVDIYVNYFKSLWGYDSSYGTPDLNLFKQHETYSNLISDNTERSFIRIKDNELLVHLYYKAYQDNSTKKRSLIYTVLKEVSGAAREMGVNTLLDLLKESSEKGYNVKLKFCEVKNNSVPIQTADNGKNYLEKLLSEDSQILTPGGVIWLSLLPYFIFFSQDVVIIEWWENYKDSENILKIMDIIKNSDQWSKFNSIVSINGGETAAKISEIGF